MIDAALKFFIWLWTISWIFFIGFLMNDFLHSGGKETPRSSEVNRGASMDDASKFSLANNKARKNGGNR